MKQILLVDDEPHVIRLMKLALERAGYQVSSAGNGEQALAYIEEREPDVLITDIDMPVMTGAGLCKRIKDDMPKRKFLIIVLTCRTETGHREWSQTIPNLVFLEKPVSIRRLVSLLEEYFVKATRTEVNQIAG